MWECRACSPCAKLHLGMALFRHGIVVAQICYVQCRACVAFGVFQACMNTCICMCPVCAASGDCSSLCVLDIAVVLRVMDIV